MDYFIRVYDRLTEKEKTTYLLNMFATERWKDLIKVDPKNIEFYTDVSAHIASALKTKLDYGCYRV